jgi:hypothetical protein
MSVSQSETSKHETRGQVFEALLQDWRDDERNLIAEFSGDMDAENAEADRQMDEWRRRYREATP